MTDAAAVQRRTVTTLVGSQIAGGIGLASGFAVAALAAESLSGSAGMSGLAQTSSVLGSAMAAVPLARLMAARGRRTGLVTGYIGAAIGALVCILAGDRGLFWPFIAGMFLLGLATAAGLQARYAATDLATAQTRARSLSVVVWATTVGVVLGPNLTGPGAAVAQRLGLPDLMGPYVFAMAGFAVSALVVSTRLRPDPLLTARDLNAASTERGTAARPTAFGVLGLILTTPAALIGVSGMATAHTAMVAVMSMTPVHLHHGGATLSVIGLVISVHVAGMYALSPVFGWLADRFGRVVLIIAGQLLIVTAAVTAGVAAADDSRQVGAGLTLLGLGWSCSLVGGSTLLSESVEISIRPSVQGVADLIMGLSAAGGAALAGLVIGSWGYGMLNALAGSLAVVPILVVLNRARRPMPA